MDVLFCNGDERCSPDAPAADARGCVAGVSPCSAGTCDEANSTCESGCPDADGDGHTNVACGGDDCDDGDGTAFPGNPEVCDRLGHDEDCDPSTLGPDLDGDGYVHLDCCNRQASGVLLCGLDCNDASGAVNPEAVDRCGSGDEDCDFRIDEDPDLIFFRDIDGDGYGVPTDTVMACGAPGGYALLDTDCNDTLAANNPAARELCDVPNGVTPDPYIHDQNCDGAVDEGCLCQEGASQDCGGAAAMAMIGTCREGQQTCVDMPPAGTQWGPCSSIEPVAVEACDGQDDDCDTRVDESFACRQNETVSGTTACGNPGARRCSGSCAWLDSAYFAAESASTCDYCDDTGAGIGSERTSFATGMRTRVIDENSPRYGSAFEFSGSISLVGSGATTAGSAVTALQTMGHGQVTFEAAVDVSKGTSTPGQGWALFIVEPGSGNPLGGTTNALGVPRQFEGLSAEWHFNGNNGDQVLLRALNRTAGGQLLDSTASGVIPTLDGATTGQIIQGLRIVATPDTPGTAANETSVRIYVTTWATMPLVAECGTGGTAPACSFRLTPGMGYLFGISAATGTNTSNVYTRVAARPTATITGLCPGD